MLLSYLYVDFAAHFIFLSTLILPSNIVNYVNYQSRDVTFLNELIDCLLVEEKVNDVLLLL